MMREVILCRVCGGTIGPHWQVFAHASCQQPPAPAPDVSPWTVQKAANRLQRTVERVESRKWLPKLPYVLTGQAKRELRAAQALLDEAGQALLRKE